MATVWYLVLGLVVLALVLLALTALSVLRRLGPLNQAMWRLERREAEVQALQKRLAGLEPETARLQERMTQTQQLLVNARRKREDR